MSKEIALLITGGAIGLFSSIITTLVSAFLQQRREQKKWEHEKEVREEGRRYRQLESIRDMVQDENIYSAGEYRRTPSILRDPEGEYCLVIGAMVSLVGGEKRPVQQLVAGDLVNSYDTKKRAIFPAKVLSIVTQPAKEYVVFNESLKTSLSHYLLSTDGWECAKDIKVGTFLIREDGSTTEVESIHLVHKQANVVGVNTESRSNFFAEGYCVCDHLSKNSGIFEATSDYEEIVEITEDGKVIVKK